MEAEQKFGIKETTEGIDFSLSLVEAYEKISEDKKISAGDFIYLVKPAELLTPAVEGGQKIPLELAELSDEEQALLLEKYGDLLNDPDWVDLFRGTATQVRAIKRLIEKRKATRSAA